MTDQSKQLVSLYDAYQSMKGNSRPIKSINEDGEAANAPAGAMSSGPILSTSVANPGSPDAVYVLFKGGKKKTFNDKIQMRSFLEKNKGWELVNEAIRCLKHYRFEEVAKFLESAPIEECIDDKSALVVKEPIQEVKSDSPVEQDEKDNKEQSKENGKSKKPKSSERKKFSDFYSKIKK